MSSIPRYDRIADWYAETTLGWYATPALLLPDVLTDQRVLDLACGQGHLSRWLADRGAEVVGVDLSVAMLEIAQTSADAPGREIEFLPGDVTGMEWWDGTAFDGVACHMALMDIDDLEGALRTSWRVLRPGGWFTFSVFHPCYPGGSEGSASGLPSWPPNGGYSQEGWWTTDGVGVRGQVGAVHRMLATYLNAVIRAGFVLEEFAEHGPNVPTFLLVRATKPE